MTTRVNALTIAVAVVAAAIVVVGLRMVTAGIHSRLKMRH